MKCIACEDCFWVCENHPSRPWDGDNACRCSGAGMPCPRCNPCDETTPPKTLAGMKIIWDAKHGWRH
jgi:hypothetical protein